MLASSNVVIVLRSEYLQNSSISFSASDENAIIRVKYANNPEEDPGTVSTTIPLDKFNIPGQKKNFPIDTNQNEHYNSTNNDNENPTTQDILQGIMNIKYEMCGPFRQ